MAETIYTIPINEVFEENIETGSQACPFCTLKAKLESDELEIILGASMMEPDIRIKTNELGFCSDHFSKMLRFSKRLPLALILESHIGELHSDLTKKGIMKPSPDKIAKKLDALTSSCYVCSRAGYNEKRMLSNALYMWQTDDEYRKKFAKQPYFCVEHSSALLNLAKNELPKKVYGDFCDALCDVSFGYLGTLCEDVSSFVKSFDYRYNDRPLTDAEKISVERAIRYLSGDRSVAIEK